MLLIGIGMAAAAAAGGWLLAGREPRRSRTSRWNDGPSGSKDDPFFGPVRHAPCLLDVLEGNLECVDGDRSRR
jgi:hypothetical protein